MDGINQWMKSLVCYLVLMSAVIQLLPSRKYERYLRLFSGMVLVLLVFGPFGEVSGLGEQAAGAFERITFQNDAALLRREIEDIDGKRMERLFSGYREVVEADLAVMAEGTALECLEASAVINTDLDGSDFGRLLSVRVRVRARENRAEANRGIAAFKRRVKEYYGVEEGDIAVILEIE